jgi:type II secretory pathway component PulF
VFGDFLGPIGREARDGLTTIAGNLWLRDRALADAMGAIAGAIEAGLPLSSAAGEATQVERGGAVGRRLQAWADAMSAGETPAAAARTAKLPAMVTGVLAVGESGGEILPSICYLQRYYNQRFHRSVELLRGAIVPVGVLALGAGVLLVTIHLLSPLWLLIDAAIVGGQS